MESLGLTTAAVDLRARLTAPLNDDPDYWTFAADSKRTMGHALFNYPAMMVPQVQGALLDAWIAADRRHTSVLDPFAGSGTVLTECMLRGLDVRSVDINPLALLLLRVKARPLKEDVLRTHLEQIRRDVARDAQTDTLGFRGCEKWFNASVAVRLTRIFRAIASLDRPEVRRFFWVCQAATVRQVSNSRTSTFKLHVYEPSVLATRYVDPIAEFERIAADNIKEATAQRKQLESAGLLTRNGYYRGITECRLSDVRSLRRRPHELADALMTSPPYGDNRTTVPYGQYAYLPLHWIDPRDLDGGDQLAPLIETPYRTDVASLGGKSGPTTMSRLAELSEASGAIRDTRKTIQDREGDGIRRFATFVTDLDEAMGKINMQLRPYAFQFWTLGERSISGHRIPTTQIVADMAALRGCTEVVTLTRAIPNGRKRMAIRNDTVATMGTESILVLQGPSHTSDLPG